MPGQGSGAFWVTVKREQADSLWRRERVLESTKKKNSLFVQHPLRLVFINSGATDQRPETHGFDEVLF